MARLLIVGLQWVSSAWSIFNAAGITPGTPAPPDHEACSSAGQGRKGRFV